MNISRNVIIHFLGKLVPAFTNLLIMIGGIRILGKADFGKYNLMFSAVVMASSLCVGWIQQSCLRFLSGENDKKNLLTAHYRKLGLWASLGCGTIMLVSGNFYFELDPMDNLIYTGFSILFSYLAVYLTILQASFRSFRYAVTESLFYLLAVLFALLLIFGLGQKDFNVFFMAMLLALMIVLSIQFLASKKKEEVIQLLHRMESPGFVRKAFSFGFPLTVWLLLSSTLNYMDRFIINRFYGYEEVGIYGFVYDFIFRVGGFLSLPILLAYHPAIAKAWNEKDFVEGKKLIRKALKAELLILTAIFFVVYLFHDWIFSVFFHLEDASSRSIYLPVALSAVFWQMSLLIQKPLELNASQTLMITGIVIALLLNLILNLLTVPSMGFVSAAYNTLFSSLFYLVFVSYFYTREFKKAQA